MLSLSGYSHGVFQPLMEAEGKVLNPNFSDFQ